MAPPWLARVTFAGCLATFGAAQDAGSPPAERDAKAWLDALASPGAGRETVRELVQLGPAALPALHRALCDPRPEVVQWSLFACSALPGDVASLREPIRRHLANRHLGIALAARQAWPVLDGGGRTLVADYHANSVLQIEPDGSSGELVGVGMAMSATRLPDGNLLVAAYRDDRVIEFDPSGNEVWSFADVVHPSDAQRLPDGNTLIADSSNTRVVEVDRDGEIVWSYDHDVRPIDVDRLGNGNTLIASYHASGAVEVDRAGNVVWQWPGQNVRAADRQLDGTTLLALTDEHRVVLVRPDNTLVREWQVPFDANDAALLANGHLVVAGEGAVVEWDDAGTEVWRAPVRYAGRVARLGVRAETPVPR